MKVISIEQVHFAYQRKDILKDINLDFDRGGVISLLGPNGSGKTTLLKIMLGLLQPKSGVVSFDGQPLISIPRPVFARQIAYVPQVHREAFAYTVEDVVLMGRAPYHSFFSAYSAEDHEIAADSLDRLGILHLKERPYTEISGGERQLALIARALTQGADVFIMDEPVNGLDYGNQMRLLDGIRRLAAEGLTFIMTTHFPDHALMTADRVILLKNGAVIDDGKPEQTITEDAIFELYRINVNVVSMTCGSRVCMPIWASGATALAT
jgi:iron complex transport system ATP-binding protein